MIAYGAHCRLSQVSLLIPFPDSFHPDSTNPVRPVTCVIHTARIGQLVMYALVRNKKNAAGAQVLEYTTAQRALLRGARVRILGGA